MTRSFSAVAGARPSALFLMSHWVTTQDLVQGRAGATVRASVQAFVNITGRDRDIPAPDVYTNDMIMSWMTDEYANFRGEPCPGLSQASRLHWEGRWTEMMRRYWARIEAVKILTVIEKIRCQES